MAREDVLKSLLNSTQVPVASLLIELWYLPKKARSLCRSASYVLAHL